MEIEKFLYGHDDTKYLVNLVGNYYDDIMKCIYHFPNGDKKMVEEKYIPFVYVRDLKKLGIEMFPLKSNSERKAETKKYELSFKTLKTHNSKRLIDGYTHIVYGKSIGHIKRFFEAGIANFKKDENRLLYILKPEEMFLIQKGKRLFKGIDSYNDLHKVTFDIETTGLTPEDKRIFMIGVKDNKGSSELMVVKNKDDNEEEKNIIKEFFKYYTTKKPAIINHYNGENFDWNFIFKRCEILGLDLLQRRDYKGKSIFSNITTLNNSINIKRFDNASVKYGNETHKYTKTNIWGISNIDIMHAAKRTQAINSDIKNVRLKYICQFEGIAKPNRMYVKGDEIYEIWSDNLNYVINPKNNIYKIVPDSFQEKPLKYLNSLVKNENKKDSVFKHFKLENDEELNTLIIITGSEIIKDYLIDDLIETDAVDLKYNESSFLLAQMIPTTFERICTMGNAAVWKLIMTAWSYENDLAIPMADQKEDFSGGLARAYYVGFARDLGKIDFAGLYPTIQLTYDAFPDSDVLNVLKKILLYLLTTRNKYKELANDETLEKVLRSFYKTKQLPLKILNNSLFGALGSGEAFPWGESAVAARITCIGRLHLRKLIRFFINYSYVPILAVTDGVNFEIPKFVNRDINNKKLANQIPINDLIFEHEGKTYIGHDAIVEKYNFDILKFNINENRFIKVDNDGLFKSSLTLSRINYALLLNDKLNKDGSIKEKGKLKLTGNTIKSKTMPEYIEDFIDKGMELIFNDKPEEFIEYYYNYLEKIYYKQIPLKKIASKSRIKQTIKQYQEREKDKNGKAKAKQAHMELCIINDNTNFEIGTLIYYVNIGTAKSHGDVKVIKNKKTGEEIFCSKMIDAKTLEENPESLGEYNVKKYIEAFNKRITEILIGFTPEVIVKIIKDNPNKREFFTKEELKLSKTPLDSIKNSMSLEEAEIKHWNNTGYDPRTIYPDFTLPENFTLNGVEEYKNKIISFNKKFTDINLKSIYEKHKIGDYVLKKNKEDYTFHKLNENEYLEDVTEEILNLIRC